MRILRSFIYTLLALVLVAALAVGLLVGTQPGQQFIARQAGTFASTPDQRIAISGLSGLVTGTLRIDRIDVSNEDGTIATLENIAVDWSPRALFARTVDIERLAIARTTIERPLAAAEQAEDTADEASALPDWTLRVGAFDFGEIALGEALVQQPVRLTAQGMMALDQNPVAARLELDARRIDDAAGHLTADVAFVPDQSQLDLAVSLDEPAGGTLARLLDVAGLPALAITVDGGGTLDDWKADLAVAFDGRETVTGAARIAASGDGHRLTAELNGTPGPLLPRLATPFAAGDIDLDLDITRRGDGSVSIAAARLQSATTRLSAAGGLDLAAGSVDLTADFSFADDRSAYSFAFPDGSEAELGAVTFSARAVGGLNSADITLSGRIASANTQDYEARNLIFDIRSRGADLAAEAIPFTATVKADLLQTPFDQVDPLLEGPIAVDLAGLWQNRIARVESGQISTGVLRASLSGDVQPLAGLFDLSVDGTLAARANPQLVTAFGTGDITLEAHVSRNADGSLTVTGLDAKGSALTIAGNAVLGGEDLDASLTANLADLGRFQPEVSGSIAATVTAKGPRTAPAITVTAQGSDIVLQDKALSDLELGFDGILSAEAPRGDLTLSAVLDAKQLNASASIQSADGTTRIDDIRLVVGSAEITGAIQRALGDQPGGSFSIAVPDLAEFGPLLLRNDLAGSVNGTVEIAPRDGTPAAQIALTASGLQAQGVELGQTAINASIAMPEGGLSVDGTVRIDAVQSGATRVESIALTASTDGTRTQFDANAMFEGAPVVVKGSLLSDAGAIDLALDEANGSFQGLTARLAAPSTVSIRDGTARIEDARLDVGGGAVTLSGTAGEELDLAVDLNAFPATVIDQFAKQGLQGSLSGRLDVSGPAAAPVVGYNIAWRNASAAPLAEAGLAALSVDANGRYGGNAVSLDATIAGGGLQARLGGTVNLGDAPTGNLSVNGTLPFAAAAPALARAGLRLDGTASLDLSISGNLTAPQISGTISTSGATFVDTGSAIVIREIAATARLSGKELRIEQFTGTLGSNGRLSVAGTVGIDPDSGLPADLTITMREGRYADGNLLAATFNADLTLKGPLAVTPTLGGAINVDRADISIPEKLPNALSPLGVEHVNAPAGVRQQVAQMEDVTGSTASGGGLALDLAINAPRRVYVRGRGLDAELGGSLRLSGTTADTRASGSLRLIRGRLDILTKRLTIDRGNIGFSGALDPVVDFRASTSSNGITASILVNGPASSPRISFTSSPSLPDDEVLAQLLFGKSLTQLSPAQIVQLANALSTLTGAGGDGGILTRLRQTLGIDNLDITADESGEGAAVGVGRYINDRTYIGVKQGTSSGSTSVTTNIDLTDTLKAKGEVNAQGETKAGIFFEREY